jgi:hypothetical protein
MVAPNESLNAALYRVFWQRQAGRPWLSAAFPTRGAAMACFFHWMSRGVLVRWLGPGETERAGE